MKGTDRQSLDRVLIKIKEQNDKLGNRVADLEHHEGIGRESYILVQDQKASGTNGGGFTSGAWQTRALNTVVNDAGGYVSLAANQITLAAGTYRFRVSAPANQVDTHQARFQNITSAATIAYGTSERVPGGTAVVTHSLVMGRFTIAASAVFEVQHRCNVTRAADGFGIAGGFGNIEIYSVLELWRE